MQKSLPFGLMVFLYILFATLFNGISFADQSKTDHFYRGTPANPLIQTMIDSVSADSLHSYLDRLVGFHTRHTNSDTSSPDTGIGAARNWMLNKYDQFDARTNGGVRGSFFVFSASSCGVTNNAHKNVLATITGTTAPERYFIASGHMDNRTVNGCDNVSFAPGANDDGSGTVASIELARVMSKFANSFESSLILMAVTGEDVGLLGSTAYADWALANNMQIDGMITNDVVGNITGCINPACANNDFITDSTSVRHFSGGPSTSSSRQMARYMKLKAEQYVTDVDWNVNLIPAIDRPGRGGDHIPFFDNGYTAVRFTEPHENGDGTGNNGHQHNETDVVEFVNFNYLSRIVKTNLAGLACLAMAPKTPSAPLVVQDIGNGSELLLSWERANSEADFAGYRVAVRHPDSLFYQEIIPVGDTTRFMLSGLTPEAAVYLSYSALDADSNESIFSQEVLATPRVVPFAPQGLNAVSTPTEIQLNWNRNVELDLGSYTITRTGPGANEQIFSVNAAVTDFADATVQPHVLYHYSLTAVDLDGNESAPSASVPGQLATHDRGILVIDATRDGNGSPQLPRDDSVDVFYERVLEDFTIAANWDVADSVQISRQITDADIGIYSTVIYHNDVRLRTRQASEDTTALRKYLQNGGKLLMSGWKLVSSISGNNQNEKIFSPGEFAYDYLKLDTTLNVTPTTLIDFRGADPIPSIYPVLTVDSSKYSLFGGDLNAMEAIQSFRNVDPPIFTLYTYRSSDDPPSAFHGLPVAYNFIDSNYGIVVFNFPLYFMEEDNAREVIKLALSSLGEIVGIDDDADRSPVAASFELEQNFPNPFNPSTKIRYHLANSGPVQITIYNLLGEKVATLVDREQAAGTYTIEWNGRDKNDKIVASGLYLYRMESKNFVKIRKLVLVR